MNGNCRIHKSSEVYMNIYSFSPFGYEGALVNVEVDLRRGIPAVDIVGLADSAVKESRERMQAAIRNSGFDFPLERVLISLSPADLKKEGAGFDLPIALAVLEANAEGKGETDFISESVLVMGELELSGHIRPIKGVHAAVSTALACGISYCIVPEQNADEAREAGAVRVYGADTLENAMRALKDFNLYENPKSGNESSEKYVPNDCCDIDGVLFSKLEQGFEFSEVKGQYRLIRGLEIAACGGHNLLALGAPGCGKTMAIQKFPAINPVLSIEEAQSVTRIWSLAGLIKPSQPLVRIPPFRMPHQTSSIEGICGGGVNCRPGEISLAHHGVLFLDEAAEFRSSVLQMLRVPIENKNITLCRAGRSTCYPADFQLFMAVNPCPCGNYGSKTKICLCSMKSIDQYWKKFSAPLLDRIDLRIFVGNEEAEKNENNESENPRRGLNSTLEIRQKIAAGVKFMKKRQNKKNNALKPDEIAQFCIQDEESKKILSGAVNRYSFSPRMVSSCVKVARTIADLEQSDLIRAAHMRESIDFHKLCANMTPIMDEA